MTSVADFLSQPPAEDEPSVQAEATEPAEFTVTERTIPEPETAGSDGRPTCQEPGCEKDCRKRRNSDEFFPFCATHNALRNVGVTGPSPKSQNYQQLEEQRKKAAREVENSIIGLFQPIQVGLMASNDAYCATIIGQEVPPLAKAAGDLSMEFPWLQAAVGTVDRWAALSMLIFHAVKLGCAIAVHHEWMPYDGPVKFLVPPPDSFKVTSPNGDSPTG